MILQNSRQLQNMLNSEYTEIGVGVIIDSDGAVYATQNFC
ncbi:MAG: hypothetical protein K8823_1180 [Cenarchaeum symbiont of Oopsacas minuta]|nr:hypothetical protein [Cenarchaeum symbiont of Oopsacas minuta]MDI1495872.1 hypothetical protein [Cenarchaeum symbiont of Oopsacas minuta]